MANKRKYFGGEDRNGTVFGLGLVEKGIIIRMNIICGKEGLMQKNTKPINHHHRFLKRLLLLNNK
jgi:hypothetical protein